MSSQTFEYREDEYENLHKTLRSKLEVQLPKLQGEERKRLQRDIDRGAEEATSLVQEMENETQKAPPPYRSEMTTKVRKYRRDMDVFKRDLRNASSQFGSSRQGAAFDDEFEREETSQRAQLFQGTQSLNRASESIARSQRVAAETDMIGADIVDELGQQREQLVRTRDRLQDTDENLSKSRKVLKTMARRVMTNKLIIIIIIVLEFIILGGVIYWKFFS